ncbi:alpha/beta hydrolase-fold protein [Kribbella sp. NBC_01505]|uniref:alpha/beta hydrolase n=1 Tax=Kribbella sp. NBC_01505 TaxID=2903580 RepID=UPI003865AB0D
MATSAHTYTVLPPRTVRSPAFDWSHEVQIALPPSYDGSGRSYPVLWATDASLTFSLTVGTLALLTASGQTAEAIVVGIGAPASTDAMEFSRRRAYEFYSRERWLNAGVGAQYAQVPAEFLNAGGGAERFLAFLADELRPQLANEFRFDETDHGLLGDSAGGYFAIYALLTRNTAFAKYLIGSPAASGCADHLFELEQEGSALAGDVFLGAGEAEMTDPFTASGDILGSMTRLTQTLRLRDHPDLRLTSRIFPGENHYSAVPAVITAGLRHLY